MQSCYVTAKPEIISILDMLLKTQVLKLENAETVITSFTLYSTSNADFSDCAIEPSAFQAGCDYSATFDRNAAKTAAMKFIF